MDSLACCRRSAWRLPARKSPSHLERKFVTLVDSSNLYRGEWL
jgi:hypothetical protein